MDITNIVFNFQYYLEKWISDYNQIIININYNVLDYYYVKYHFIMSIVYNNNTR